MKLDRTNQLLLATVAVLGGLALLRFADGLRPAETIWSVDPISEPAVTQVTWTTPEGRLVLDRVDSGWMIREPIERPADREKLSTLLRDWSEGFAPDLRLDPRPSAEALAAAGLDEAHRSELRIEGPSGTLAHLLMGAKIAGGSHYVQRPGRPGLFRGRVPGGYRLDIDPDAWRDTRLFPFAKDDLAGLTIEGPHGAFAFRRVEEPDRAFWEGVSPAGFVPSSQALDQMGRSLANLQAKKILEGDDAAAARIAGGLEAPVLVVVATTEGGRTYTLRFGAEDAQDKTVLAEIDGDARLFRLAAGVLRQFDKDAETLRDKTALRFRRTDGPVITWSENERIVVIEPAGERDWTVVRPGDFTPDPRELGLAANSLLNLRAAELRFEERPLLPKAAPMIQVQTADGASQSIQIAPEPDADGKYVAVVAGKEATFVLRGAVVERLLRVFRGEE